MTAEQYKPIYHWFSDHPAVKRLVVFLDRWLPLVPFVCYPVLLCLLNLLFWSLEQVNVLFIAGLIAVLLCCLFPLHPFVVRYRRLQDPLPPGRRRGADGKKGGKTG